MGELTKQFRRWLQERGPLWTLLYLLRAIGRRVVHRLDQWLIRIEKRKLIIGENTVSSHYHSARENREIWESYDWSERGDEWTADVRKLKGLDPEAWKQNIISDVMLKYMVRGSVLLEIGPGGGRWTETLRTIAGRLVLADISNKCLTLCRERFDTDSHIEYYLIDDGTFGFLTDDSIDCVWSYDVFVHINPSDTEVYLKELCRVLKPGGLAVIHHAGSYPNERDAARGFRSHMTQKLFSHLAEKHEFEVLEQNTTAVHKPGDCITVMTKP